jgi:enterochelin esterase-like enzyme
MVIRTVLFMSVVICTALAGQSDTARVWSSQTGDVRVHEFHSEIFGNTRKLRVLLPSGYDAPANRNRVYPVLYLNDGQNLFDSTTAVFNKMEWRVDETVARLVADRKIPPIIVVGIDNAGRRGRAREYLPYPDEYLSPPEPHPDGKRYPEFLAREVLPFVRAHYRVATDRRHVGVGGSSYGAVAALYTAMIHTELFGLLLAESPSLYVDSTHILRDAARLRVPLVRTYLGVGTNEEGKPNCNPKSPVVSEAEADVRHLEAILRRKAIPLSRIKVIVAPCAVHNEDAWATRLPTALTFLFGR